MIYARLYRSSVASPANPGAQFIEELYAALGKNAPTRFNYTTVVQRGAPHPYRYALGGTATARELYIEMKNGGVVRIRSDANQWLHFAEMINFNWGTKTGTLVSETASGTDLNVFNYVAELPHRPEAYSVLYVGDEYLSFAYGNFSNYETQFQVFASPSLLPFRDGTSTSRLVVNKRVDSTTYKYLNPGSGALASSTVWTELSQLPAAAQYYKAGGVPTDLVFPLVYRDALNQIFSFNEAGYPSNGTIFRPLENDLIEEGGQLWVPLTRGTSGWYNKSTPVVVARMTDAP